MPEDHVVPTPVTEVTVTGDESPAAVQAREVIAMRESILRKLYYQVGKNRIAANNRDWYVSVALAVRDRVVDGWHRSTDKTYASVAKRV